jgi:hypothetical protein
MLAEGTLLRGERLPILIRFTLIRGKLITVVTLSVFRDKPYLIGTSYNTRATTNTSVLVD